MRILALDLSLTRTGWALGSMNAKGHGVLVPGNALRGVHRLAWYRAALDNMLTQDAPPELAVIEGYSMGAQRGSSGVAQMIGEQGGVVRLLLHDRGVPFVEIPPSSLKRYATGKGNAPKAAVLAEAIRRLGYDGSDDNEADALWLLALACDYYGGYNLGTVKVPKSHRVALDKIRWPTLTVYSEEPTA